MRKTTLPVGTKVYARHAGLEGVILNNRRTMPDMKHCYDYQIELDFEDGEGPRQWGFAASELDEVKP